MDKMSFTRYSSCMAKNTPYRNLESTLRRQGFSTFARQPGAKEKWRYYIDGAVVRVASASQTATGEWRIGITASDPTIDAYIVLLRHGNNSLYLIFPAPITRTGFRFSFRSLMRQYSANIDDWDTLRAIVERKQRAAA